jgi:hypothetical protein
LVALAVLAALVALHWYARRRLVRDDWDLTIDGGLPADEVASAPPRLWVRGGRGALDNWPGTPLIG